MEKEYEIELKMSQRGLFFLTGFLKNQSVSDFLNKGEVLVKCQGILIKDNIIVPHVLTKTERKKIVLVTISEYYSNEKSADKFVTKSAWMLEQKQITSFFLKLLAEQTLMSIGDIFECTHANIINSLRRVSTYYSSEKGYAITVDTLRVLLEQKAVLVSDSLFFSMLKKYDR